MFVSPNDSKATHSDRKESRHSELASPIRIVLCQDRNHGGAS